MKKETFYPMSLESTTRKRRILLLIIFGVITISLLCVLFRLQIIEHDQFGNKVIEQITVGSSFGARRGEILDRNGKVLATNRTVWRIYISPVDIKKAEKKKGAGYADLIAKGLSEILAIPYEAIYEKTQKSAYLDQTIYKSADEETVKRVLLFTKEHNLSGMIHTEAGTERYYPFGTLAAHTIGFTGSDNQGLFGLESYYNAVLSGNDGRYLASVDSQGVKLPNAYTDYIPAEDGMTLVTTLDTYMQTELAHQLEQARIASDAQNRASGIVMNVKTGAILAIATSPSFDLNHPYTLTADLQAKLDTLPFSPTSKEYKAKKTELLYTMWSNKAVSEIYEPGSTFKIVTVAAALDCNAAAPSNIFHCPGYYMVGGCRISCHKRIGHGTLTLREGLMHSCNPTMMQLAERMGKENFYKYYQAFGYGKKTGIDLPGEGMGLFHSLSSLGSTELATASFGQRFKVSILQQITAVATLANGGTPVTPHLLSSLQNAEGKTVFTYQSTEKDPIISAETARTVAEILEEGVSGDGGAKNAYVEGYRIAAKTGTSEKFEILDANGNSFLRIGSCVAFAPYDNAEIAVIIVVDEPTSANKYGSVTAAPYVSGYLSSVLPYLGIPENETEEITLPSLLGKNVTEAKGMLSKLGFSVRVVGKGKTVLSQFPKANTALKKEGGAIVLYTEETTVSITVPNVTGKPLHEAFTLFINEGFYVNLQGPVTDKLSPGATVFQQSLSPGTLHPLGTPIVIQVIQSDDSD